jgi:hypothetical protein
VVCAHNLFKQEWAKPILQVALKQFRRKEKSEVKTGEVKSRKFIAAEALLATHRATFYSDLLLL